MGGIRVIHQDAIAYDVNGEFLPLSRAFTQAIPPVLLVFNRNELRSGEAIEEVINFTRQNRADVIAKQFDDSLQWRKQEGLPELKVSGKTAEFLESYKNAGENEQERCQICQCYIESELNSILKNKEEFIIQANLAAESNEKDSLRTRVSKIIDRLQKGIGQIIKPKSGSFMRRLSNTFPPLFAIQFAPPLNRLKLALADMPPKAINPDHKTSRLLNTLKQLSDSYTILSDIGVDIYVADDIGYLDSRKNKGYLGGYSDYSGKQIFLRSDQIADSKILPEETTHFIAEHLDNFDAQETYKSAAYADLGRPETLSVLNKYGMGAKFSNFVSQLESIISRKPSSYDRSTHPHELLVEIEYIRENSYIKQEGMPPEEADTRLAKEFPNTYPFFKKFLELRHDAAEKIRYNRYPRFDAPRHVVTKVQSIMQERECTNLDSTENIRKR